MRKALFILLAALFIPSISAAQTLSAPLAPSGINVDEDFRQLIVSWTAPAENASRAAVTQYRVERAGASTGPWLFEGTTSTTNYTDSNLEPEIVRFYRIFAESSVGDSPASAVIRGETRALLPPSPPRNVRLQSEGTSIIDIFWDPPLADTSRVPVTTYRVDYSEDGSTNWRVLITTEEPNARHSGLPAGARRYYRVSADSDNGRSGFSTVETTFTEEAEQGLTPEQEAEARVRATAQARASASSWQLSLGTVTNKEELAFQTEFVSSNLREGVYLEAESDRGLPIPFTRLERRLLFAANEGNLLLKWPASSATKYSTAYVLGDGGYASAASSPELLGNNGLASVQFLPLADEGTVMYSPDLFLVKYERVDTGLKISYNTPRTDVAFEEVVIPPEGLNRFLFEDVDDAIGVYVEFNATFTADSAALNREILINLLFSVSYRGFGVSFEEPIETHSGTTGVLLNSGALGVTGDYSFSGVVRADIDASRLPFLLSGKDIVLNARLQDVEGLSLSALDITLAQLVKPIFTERGSAIISDTGCFAQVDISNRLRASEVCSINDVYGPLQAGQTFNLPASLASSEFEFLQAGGGPATVLRNIFLDGRVVPNSRASNFEKRLHPSLVLGKFKEVESGDLRTSQRDFVFLGQPTAVPDPVEQIPGGGGVQLAEDSGMDNPLFSIILPHTSDAVPFSLMRVVIAVIMVVGAGLAVYGLSKSDFAAGVVMMIAAAAALGFGVLAGWMLAAIILSGFAMLFLVGQVKR